MHETDEIDFRSQSVFRMTISCCVLDIFTIK